MLTEVQGNSHILMLILLSRTINHLVRSSKISLKLQKYGDTIFFFKFKDNDKFALNNHF
jgi:hypothetical protein